MDKRKSLVFARQYRNSFSRRINTLVPKKQPNQNCHWHSDARFSWLENNDLPPRCRHYLFLTRSYRDNPIFFTQWDAWDLFGQNAKIAFIISYQILVLSAVINIPPEIDHYWIRFWNRDHGRQFHWCAVNKSNYLSSD